jgi:lipopolysaccharide/colanic/teichoic acid biosynthesis glycosyltransferase
MSTAQNLTVAGAVGPGDASATTPKPSGLAALVADIYRTPHARWSRRVAVDIVTLLDGLAVVLGALVPAVIYASTYVGKGTSTPWFAVVQAGVIAAILACGLLRHWGMYAEDQVHDLPIRPARLLGALGLAFIAVLGLGNPFATSHPLLWIWYAAWASASFTALLATRIAARAMLKAWTEAGRFEARVAVFGAGTIARRVHDHLSTEKLGVRFVGVYDDRAGESRLNPEGLVVAGRLDALIKAAMLGRIDRIIVALPQTADARSIAVVRKLESLPVSLHIVSHIANDLFAAAPGHNVSSLGTIGLLDVKRKPLADWSRLLKRLEDHFAGVLLLWLSLPLILPIAAAIQLDSSGPVIVRERRRGRDGQVIHVAEFRTTRWTSEGCSGDVTRTGRWLRASRLYKLPRMINVLKGELSLVGPSPYELVPSSQRAEMLEDHANRYRVKPGMIEPGEAMVGNVVAPAVGARRPSGKETIDQIRACIDREMSHISHWSLGRDLRLVGLALKRVVIASLPARRSLG